jgi:hypothetical protein
VQGAHALQLGGTPHHSMFCSYFLSLLFIWVHSAFDRHKVMAVDYQARFFRRSLPCFPAQPQFLRLLFLPAQSQLHLTSDLTSRTEEICDTVCPTDAIVRVHGVRYCLAIVQEITEVVHGNRSLIVDLKLGDVRIDSAIVIVHRDLLYLWMSPDFRPSTVMLRSESSISIDGSGPYGC